MFNIAASVIMLNVKTGESTSYAVYKGLSYNVYNYRIHNTAQAVNLQLRLFL